MARTRLAYLEAAAFWAPTLPSWDIACAAFRGEGPATEPPARRPAPELLPPAERRRAPDTVALALDVASRAVAASGREARELASVFTSAHGDLAVTDYICSTLVGTPLLLSPTKFHNSVHNAASGYWGIATGCMQASTAVSAFESSFAAGLFEALAQCAADQRPVLLVGYDIAAPGALASTNESRGLLAVALVLSPQRSAHTRAELAWTLASGPCTRPALRSEPARALAANAMSDAVPFFEAYACADPAPLTMPIAPGMAIKVEIGAA